MILDFKQDLKNLTLHITVFHSTDDCQVKEAKMMVTKENIDYLEHIGCWLPELVLEELIRELFECNTDEDYNRALSHLDDKELNELLLKLDAKFENLKW